MSKSLSLRKAAAYVDFAPSTLVNYIERGVGPEHIRIGVTGTRRFTHQNLDTWLASLRTGGGQ